MITLGRIGYGIILVIGSAVLSYTYYHKINASAMQVRDEGSIACPNQAAWCVMITPGTAGRMPHVSFTCEGHSISFVLPRHVTLDHDISECMLWLHSAKHYPWFNGTPCYGISLKLLTRNRDNQPRESMPLQGSGAISHLFVDSESHGFGVSIRATPAAGGDPHPLCPESAASDSLEDVKTLVETLTFPGK